MSFDPAYKDRICVITGAASGIGRALAIRLAKAGAILALSDVDETGLSETVKLAGLDKTNRLITDIVDVANAEQITAYAPRVKAALGPADYVFNIAGIARVGSFDQSPLSSLEKVMDVNFYGVVRMSKAFLGQLKTTRGGLINISSIFGIIGFPGQADYCASKFAVRGFSETLAQEMAGHGVSVSCVHPGGVATNIASNAAVDAKTNLDKSRAEMNADFDKMAITTPEKAAHIILSGTAKGKRRIIVGDDAKAIQWINRLFPQNYAKIMRRLKPSAYDIL